MRVLLDTQAFLMLGVGGSADFPRKARMLAEQKDTLMVISSVSITEIAIKNSIGKLEASSDLVTEMLEDLKIVVLPFTARHAKRMFNLPLHHREPFDRMIIAVALAEGTPILGADSRFPDYEPEGLKVIWR